MAPGFYLTLQLYKNILRGGGGSKSLSSSIPFLPTFAMLCRRQGEEGKETGGREHVTASFFGIIHVLSTLSEDKRLQVTFKYSCNKIKLKDTRIKDICRQGRKLLFAPGEG